MAGTTLGKLSDTIVLVTVFVRLQFFSVAAFSTFTVAFQPERVLILPLSSRSKFTDLSESSPEVQAVYRDCKIFDDYDGVEDSTALQPRSPEPACKSPYAPSNPPARRSTPTASEASSPSSGTRSSSSTEVELSPEPAPTSSSRLYLPPTPNKDPASPNKDPASPNNDPASPVKEPDFIPYMWDYFETVFLCVLSIHARLSSKEIASILKEKDGSEVDEEDVELKIDELSGEEYGIWETWGAKNLDDSEVQTVLRRLGRIE